MSYGSDFFALDDINPGWTFLTGLRNEVIAVTQAIYRRLTTPRGGNPWDPAYGYDVRSLIGSTIRSSDAEISIAAELRKDERVEDCQVSISVAGAVWTIRINVILVGGDTFPLTLSVSKVSVDLIRGV